MNQFSISPIVVGTSRLVDSNASPAFLAILNAKEKLSKLREDELSIYAHDIVTQLHNTLQRMFDNAEASALDVDSNGHTVLNVSLCSLCSRAMI